MDQRDIVIVGGGFAGSVAAAALADGQRRVTVVEARAGGSSRFNGEWIHPPGARSLDCLGVLPALRAAGGIPVRGFAVSFGRDEPATALPYAEVKAGYPEGLAMHHSTLVEVLHANLRGRPGVEFRTGDRVIGLLSEGRRVAGIRLSSGEELRAPLTLIADGRHSRLRGALGMPASSRVISFTAALRLGAVPLPNEGYGHVFLGAPGPILAYAVRKDEVRICVDLPSEMVESKACLAERLRAEYAPWLPEPLRGAMLHSLDVERPAVCPNHAVYTRRCVAPGVALLGDAAGCSHPLTAMGMTIALRDAEILAEELRSRDDLDGALRRYQRRRYRFVRVTEAVADTLYLAFRAPNGGTTAIRERIRMLCSGDARVRSTSLALLCGQEACVGTFAQQYARVALPSAWDVVAGKIHDASLGSRARSLADILSFSARGLSRITGFSGAQARW